MGFEDVFTTPPEVAARAELLLVRDTIVLLDEEADEGEPCTTVPAADCGLFLVIRVLEAAD